MWHAQVYSLIGLGVSQSPFCCAYTKNHQAWRKRRGRGSSANKVSSTKSFVKKKTKIFRLQSLCRDCILIRNTRLPPDIFPFFHRHYFKNTNYNRLKNQQNLNIYKLQNYDYIIASKAKNLSALLSRHNVCERYLPIKLL